ncbi:MAG: single-stranded DNA-binding protein [Desulfobacterium sp.]|nr:single-stranded DNA-binding protein [Desulfobacterium sp.]
MKLESIIKQLVDELAPLTFNPPVTHVYNPLEYAHAPHTDYLKKYGSTPKEVIMVGMNPGPFGMAQNGVPFGEIEMVTDWLGIKGAVGEPEIVHPKRPIHGFDCKRSEVSGKRLWGWAKKRFQTPEVFFDRFFVANYCPLVFMEESGRNRTPNNLPVAERRQLFEICDKALRQTVAYFSPKLVVGIGKFAADRAKAALSGLDITVGQILHPSPASPKANQGWEKHMEAELEALGIK